jgi:hypothetical protein
MQGQPTGFNNPNTELFENFNQDENLMLTTTRAKKLDNKAAARKLEGLQLDVAISSRSSTSSQGKPTCRICWGIDEVDENGAFNPLISPCNCTGTISSIHL